VSIRRDYKSTTTGQRRQRARRNGLLVVTLMLIGLFGGLLAYIKGSRPQPPTATAAVAPSIPAPPAAAPVAAPPPKAAAAPAAEPEPARPKYDFYTELPKRQIEIHPEATQPRNAPQPAPARMQPVVNQRRQPSTPRGNAKAPAPVAVASGARPGPKATTAKTASTKSITAKTATPESANSKSTSAPSKAAAAKSATPEPANSKSTTKPSKSVTAKPANATASAPTPARATQPPRSLASNGSKIIVKTEQEP